MLDQNTLTEILRDVSEIIRATAEPMSREEILGFFAQQDLDDNQKNLVAEYLLKIQDETIKEAKEEAAEVKQETEEQMKTSSENSNKAAFGKADSDLFEEMEPELGPWEEETETSDLNQPFDLEDSSQPELETADKAKTKPASDESVAQFISDMSRYAKTAEKAEVGAEHMKEAAENKYSAAVKGGNIAETAGAYSGNIAGAAEAYSGNIIETEATYDEDADGEEAGRKYPSSPVFKMYLEEIESLPVYSDETLQKLYKSLLEGETEAIQKISEGWMRRILEQTVMLEAAEEDFSDVIQEGNMALFMALSELCGSKKKVDVEDVLSQATTNAMKAYIQGVDSEKDIQNVMLGKATLVNEARKHLMEENQQTPSLNELAAYTNIPKSELADILDWIERAEKNEK